MVLLLIGLCGVAVLAGVLGMLELGWRREVPMPAVRSGGDDGLAEDLERDVAAGLLAGRISAEQYRATLAALAAGDPDVFARRRPIS